MERSLTEIISNFKDASILVVGDIMLDEYVWGKATRISPEAPVVVVEVVNETSTLGGAGNVANNLLSLGARVYITGVVGKDESGKVVLSLFEEGKMDTEGIIVDEARPTTVKTRIIAHSQQVLRIDREKCMDINAQIVNRILAYAKEKLPEVKALLISDYGKGVITSSLLESIIKMARSYQVPVVVDPKQSHYIHYKGITAITPNHHEAFLLTGRMIESGDDLVDIGREILSYLECEAVLITKGEEGMILFEKNGNKVTHISTVAKKVYDVTGAGDTVVSVFSLAMASGASLYESAKLSNFAAGIVVEKVGTNVVTVEELIKRVNEYYKV